MLVLVLVITSFSSTKQLAACSTALWERKLATCRTQHRQTQPSAKLLVVVFEKLANGLELLLSFIHSAQIILQNKNLQNGK